MITIKLDEEQTENFLHTSHDLLICDPDGLPLAAIKSTAYRNHPEMEKRKPYRDSRSREELWEFLHFLEAEEKLYGELTELEKPKFLRRTRKKYRDMKRDKES